MHEKMQLILTTSFTPNFKAVWQHKAAIDFCTQNNGITIEEMRHVLYLKLQRRKHSQLDVHSKTLSFIDIAQSMQIISSRIVHKPNLSFFLLPRYSLERSGQSFSQQRIHCTFVHLQ